MKRGYSILLTALVGIMFILAFGAASSGCPKNTNDKTVNPYPEGTTGVVVDFLENSPPPEVVDGGSAPFDIIVDLENVGAVNIPKDNVQVIISGLYPEMFSKTDADFTKNPDDDLNGAQKDLEGNLIPGSKLQVAFTGLNYKGALEGNMVFPIRADICYKYSTKATGKFCARSNVLSTAPGVCEITGTKTIFSSGAPIQVTSFSENVAGTKKVSFTFKISLKGNGLLFKQGTSCANNYANKNKLYVEVNTGISGLSCQGLSDRPGNSPNSGYLRMVSGEATLTCTQELGGTTDYSTPVNLLITYDYLDSKPTEITVKHLPTG